MKRTVEQNLLSILAIGSPHMMDVMRRLPNGSWFESEPAGKAYDIIVAVFERHGIVDLTMLDAPFRDAGMQSYLIDVIVSSEVNQHPLALVRLIVEAKTIRDLHKLGRELESADTLRDPEELLQHASGQIVELQGLYQGDQVKTFQKASEVAVERAEALWAGEKTGAIRWGFTDIDGATGGLDAGELGIIAAPEKSGKTTLALQTMLHNARLGIPSIIFSGEMSYTQIITRLALALGKVSFVKHVTGKLSDADKDRFRDAAGEIGKLPIFIRDGVFSMLDVAAETRRYVDRGARLVVVDYIQRVQPLDRRGQTREQEIADISRRLKDLAQVHQLPVIALSQVNEDNRARESRAIEHDMDKMLLLVREDGQAVADVKVRQRMGSSGGLGDIKLQYETDFGLWRDYAVSREIMPVTGPAGRDDDQLAF